MQTPPPYPPPPYPPPPAWTAAPSAPPVRPRGRRLGLWIPLAALLVAVLLAAAGAGGYVIGRAEAAHPPGTVSAPFVRLQLAHGWKVTARNRHLLGMRNAAGDSISVQLGDSRQDAVASDSDVFRNEVFGITQRAPREGVGSCLPVTRVTVGGKRGEEVGLLYHRRQPAAQEDCELVWAHVQGSKYYAWYSRGGVGGLSSRVKAMGEMQQTAVWTG